MAMPAARRAFVRATGVVCAAVGVLSLCACEPAGRAVGDTQDAAPETAHSATERNELVVALIGSKTAVADDLVLDALERADLDAVYVSVRDEADAGAAARQGVRDMAERLVSVIVVSDADVTDDADGWDDALREARAAGVPVALLNPVHAPDDDTLYAVSLVLNDRAADAVALDDALVAVADDEPHDREIVVTTLS